MIDNINTTLYEQFKKEKQKAEEDMDFICMKQASQYTDQMKEVKAFMQVENYETYKNALDSGALSFNESDMNIKQLEKIIDSAVALLVPNKNNPNSNEKFPN